MPVRRRSASEILVEGRGYSERTCGRGGPRPSSVGCRFLTQLRSLRRPPSMRVLLLGLLSACSGTIGTPSGGGARPSPEPERPIDVTSPLVDPWVASYDVVASIPSARHVEGHPLPHGARGVHGTLVNAPWTVSRERRRATTRGSATPPRHGKAIGRGRRTLRQARGSTPSRRAPEATHIPRSTVETCVRRATRGPTTGQRPW